MSTFKRVFIFLFTFSIIYSCKEPYNPVLKETNENLLVVEGFINIGGEPTTIKLSRTSAISQKISAKPETGAQVSIESNSNQKYNLSESTLGVYKSAVLNLDPAQKYRLRIVVKGNEYVTDFLESKLSPVVDAVNWEIRDDALQISVNTHDVNKASRYYRWEFEETWIFHSSFYSTLVYENGAIRPRDDFNENIYKCWSSGVSNKIILGSSIKLSDDVISKQPIVSINNNSEKLTEKYSILVRQYTLTKDAFDFWENLRRNTENLGSIFDVQPSQLTGNIRSVSNPKEPVLGYISVGRIQEKRIFISTGELPLHWRPQREGNCSVPDTVLVGDVSKEFPNRGYVPISELMSESGGVYAYLASSRECTDCTIRGTKQRPVFWQ